MRLSHKLGKVATGAAFKSCRHHLRRFLMKNRAPTDFDAEAIMRTIDRDKFEAIRKRYGVESPGGDPPKYLDWKVWLEANLQRIRNLELDLGSRRRILDIGSGSGYFLYICKLLGHDAIGLDLPDFPMFGEMVKLLGVERVHWRIKPFVPLPDLGPRFDVVTAHMICFNNHKHSNLWGVREWDFFLDDLSRHLNPKARIWFELNREYDGTCYTPELKQFFKDRGARIVSHRVIFDSGIRAPAGASAAAR